MRSASNLVDLYCSSVGRNSKLLLNVPPTRSGRFADADVKALAAFAERRGALFGHEVTVKGPTRISAVRLEEQIAYGQCVSRYTVLGRIGDAWQPISSGTTIGYAKIDRFEPVTVTGLKVVVDESVAPPRAVTLRAYGG